MRIVTIEHPGEVHVHDYQLVVEQETGTASILVEQVELLVTYGPSIRVSTMAQAILVQAGSSPSSPAAITCQRRWSFPWWQTPAWLASRPRR